MQISYVISGRQYMNDAMQNNTQHSQSQNPIIKRVDFQKLSAFGVGSATDDVNQTGVTVIVAPEGACASVSVRGGGPATRETDLLRPENMVERIHAVMLSGGSAFGLRAADGVVDALSDAGVGLSFQGMCIPIVPGACLFDLLVGQPVAPTPEMGARAVEEALRYLKDIHTREAAGSDETGFKKASTPPSGRFGAGRGASVGKLLGSHRAVPGGLGIAAFSYGDIVVGAVVAVNACGSVIDESEEVIAGVLRAELCEHAFGHAEDVDTEISSSTSSPYLSCIEFENEWARTLMGVGTEAGPIDGSTEEIDPIAHTTLACLCTNVALSKAEAYKVADMAHDAFARCIFPVHTPNDGDTIFCMSSGEQKLPDATRVDLCALLANSALETAIREAVE